MMMRPPRRGRLLSADERRLWAEVARGFAPLLGRTRPEIEAEARATETARPMPPLAPAPAKRSPPAASPPLAPLEPKTRLGLRRGTLRADAKLDLHDLRQVEAHDALTGFLRRSQAAGHSLVIVVTGKGAEGSGGSLFEARGVLKRLVPHWLRLPDLRPLVVGFEEAGPHHGGAGALYVRLRRRKTPGP